MAGGDGFQLIIYVTIDGIRRTLYLDTCMEKRINASATIPTQPLQDGNTVSDHMYRNPDEFSINGTFSEFGRYENDSNNEHGFYNEYNRIAGKGIDKVTAVQTVFERIKDEGLLCDLTTIERGENGKVRYKIRKNMALQSITWTELQVSLKYSFTFKEIMTFQAQEYVPQEDSDLPNIYLPETKSLGMLMTEETNNGEVSPIVSIVIKALLETGYIRKDDAEYIVKMGGGLTARKSNDLQTNSVYRALRFIANPANIVGMFFDEYNSGWGIALNIITMGLYGTIRGIIKANDYNAANRAYKLVNGLQSHIEKDGSLNVESAKNDTNISVNMDELRRLTNFLNSIKNFVSLMCSNVGVYNVSSSIEDNSDREVVLNIGNNPYYIGFTRNKANNPAWNIQVKALSANGTPIDLDGFNGTNINLGKVCSTLEDMCDENNALFWDSTLNYQVYLFLSGDSTTEITREQIINNVTKTVTYKTAPVEHLCNLNLVVVKGHLQDEMQKIYDRIYSELVKVGYN